MTVDNPYPELTANVPKAHYTSNAVQSTDARFKRITQGLADVNGPDLIRASVENGKTPKIIWATAPTGRPHIGYIASWAKMAEFASAGADVIVNMADLFAFLYNYKYPYDVVMQRREYYRLALSAIFEAIYGTPATKSGVRFEYQIETASEKEYILDFFRLVALMSLKDSRDTDTGLRSTLMLSPLLTPAFQALDQEVYDIDIEYGGLDQAMLFEYLARFGPILGHRKRAYIMNHLLPGLNGGKMSASQPNSKIDLLDPPEIVVEKIMGAACPEGVVDNNAILAVLKLIVIPVGKMRLERQGQPGIVVQDYRTFAVEGAPYGTVLSVETEKCQFRHYSSYEEVEDDFCARRLGSSALAKAVARVMNQLLSHIRRSYKENPEWQKIAKIAYPETKEEAGPHMTQPASLGFCLPPAMREISNECVKLLPFKASVHAAEFVRLADGHTHIFRHLPIGPFPTTESFITDFIEKVVSPNREMMLYAVIDKTRPPTSVDKEGALAGFLAYTNTSLVHQSTEIAYVTTLPPFQRTHVTSNAVGLLLNFALNTIEEGGLGLRRVQWQTSTANHASIRTAEKLGFVKEGVLKWDNVYPGGKTKGKLGNGRYGPSGGSDDDLARDTVMLSMCWDDWFVYGKKEDVTRRMGGPSATQTPA